MDRPVVPGKACRQLRDPDLRSLGIVRLPGAGGAVRKLDPAAFGGADRADVPAQIGFVVLVGLAAKNAILIVEFAKQAEEAGAGRIAAAVQAARTRLRPILMTSFAFVLGVVPLTIATGAGAEMRQSLGT